MAKEHIRSWKIGSVEITRLVEVSGWEDDIGMLWTDAGPKDVLKHPWLQPHWATPEGKMIISFQCFVMRTANRQIMLDTCIGSDRQREFPVFTNMQSSFLEDLTHAGFSLDSIDTVLCTHLHFDHVGWNTRLVDGQWVPTFPNARYLFSKAEYDHWCHLRDTDGYHDLNHMFDAVGPVVDAGLVDLIDPESHQVCPEIKLMPTPGHTPDHISIMIESEGEKAVITGDMMHNPIQIAEPQVFGRFDMVKEIARDTRMKFVEQMANTNTIVIGSHFSDPTAGHVIKDASGTRFKPYEE
jgi:glyoxylase-like metal-dependent hydrolase (beta-lactamase superfamily II)